MRTNVTFTAEPTEDADRAYLLRTLFAEPAPEADHDDLPTCGLDAAFDRIDAHLAQFQADAEAQVRPRPALLLVGGGR